MMKKNYFGRFFALAMVFAGLTLTSCDKNDNAIINGEIWEPSTVKPVDGGAVVNASTPAEVSRMISRLRKEIVEAAENKETFTITINAAALNATAADNTISFFTVNNCDLVVNFTGAITTEEPLVLQSKGVNENMGISNPAIGKVAFNFPAGTSNIDLVVNMPTASVTLKPASGSLSINELKSKTALTTLYIESGVTVNWLERKGGNVVVKNGGKVIGIVGTYLYVLPNGITEEFPPTWEGPQGYLVKDSIRAIPTADDIYLVKKGKLLARDDGWYSNFLICGTDAKASADPLEIIIPDGAKAWKAKDNYTGEPNWPTLNVTGEGNATFMYAGDENSDGKASISTDGINLTRINKLSNVTVDLTHALVWNEETDKAEVLEVDTATTNYKEGFIQLPKNSENCAFNAKFIKLAGNDLADGIVSSTHKNCTFNSLMNNQDYTFEAYFPIQNDKRKSFTLAFDNCEFNQAKFYSEFNGSDDDYKAYKANISFDSSKIGGKAITKSTDMILDVKNRSKEGKAVTETFYTIDGVDYQPVFDTKTEKWGLKAIK